MPGPVGFAAPNGQQHMLTSRQAFQAASVKRARVCCAGHERDGGMELLVKNERNQDPPESSRALLRDGFGMLFVVVVLVVTLLTGRPTGVEQILYGFMCLVLVLNSALFLSLGMAQRRKGK
jgi:hypothetical protein